METIQLRMDSVLAVVDQEISVFGGAPVLDPPFIFTGDQLLHAASCVEITSFH